jgi:hypothetical protein
MDIEVRIADARDRQALKEFYSREGMNFQTLTSRVTPAASGMASETMFIVGVAETMVVAALRLDIGNDPSLGKVGFIQHFEIEDELESSDLGKRMIEKSLEVGNQRNLSCIEALVPESRTDVINLYCSSDFSEDHKEVLLRKYLKHRIF